MTTNPIPRTTIAIEHPVDLTAGDRIITNAQLIVTRRDDGQLEAWAYLDGDQGPELRWQHQLTGFDLNVRTQGRASTLDLLAPLGDDNVVWVNDSGHCGCGSPLKTHRPFGPLHSPAGARR